MIVDSLKNAKQYFGLNEKLKKGFEFLLNTNLIELEDGRYEVEGNEIYANVQSLTTKQKEEKKWEVHRDYIDIQYVISGEECMGYGLLADFRNVETVYDKEKDVEFLNGEKYNFVNVYEGDFVVFYPNDVHAPMLSIKESKNIKKVIVKVKI